MSTSFPFLPDLPVRAVLPEIGRHLAANRTVVLQSPPGSGKTTLVAPSLLDAPWLGGRRIVLLEPRRMAARAAARFMARSLGEEVGRRVGYHIRLERRVGPDTRIEVLTEGVLAQRLLYDPGLDGVGIVLFDEFHERSISADFGLALCLDVRRNLRPDLRLLVMSATLDADPVADHLGDAAVVDAPGRVWPVATRLLSRNSAAPLPDQVADAVRTAVREETGSILAFLPGEGEIRRAAERLRATALPPGVSIHPLYSALPRQAQDAAVDPPVPGARKIVLATSIAESSLTILGVRVVVDCGWMRVSRYTPRNGMSRLDTVRITRDRADQRRGRAGRTEPGVCYRLWDDATDRSLAPMAQPELMDADLTPLALQAAAWGAPGRTDLPWLTPPPDAAWRRAVELLRELEAVDVQGRITPRGRSMADIPVHPRLAHLILLAAEHGGAQRACLLAAAVTERAGETTLRNETDARRLLDRLGSDSTDRSGLPDRSEPDDWAARVRRLAAQWSRHFPVDRVTLDTGRLLSWAFPDRIARRRDAAGRFLLADGHGATVETSDGLAGAEWLVAAELQDDGPDARIRLAAPVSREEIEEDFSRQIQTEDQVVWDRRTESVSSMRRRKLGSLVLSEGSQADPDPDAVRQALFAGIRQKGVAQLPWTPATRNLQSRLLFLRRVCGEADWPDVSDAALAARLEDWLGSFVEGVSRWDSLLRRLDLGAALLSGLETRRRDLDALAPTHVAVPSGSHIQVRYDEGDVPVLAVRIQELFGLADSPRVAGGRVPVCIHLLSPAQRPVQVTSDLRSFWQNGYPVIRRELRGRYPRHAWPEDPWTAAPTSRAKPRGT